jgi:NAD-dependent deacetylase
MSDKNQIKRLAEQFVDMLHERAPGVILTGAGVSTASGIPDFRGPSGLYSKISPRTFELAFFYAHPDEYYKLAVEHIHRLSDMKPNVTHSMIAELEKRGLIDGVITQNIDGLHQKAGSKHVIEFHGNVTSYYCISCQKPYGRKDVDQKIHDSGTPRCDTCKGLIRPGIVFFDDPIPTQAAETSYELVYNSNLFIAMGSSLAVYPAALLPQQALQIGAGLIIVNKGQTQYDRHADLLIDADLSEFSNQVLALLEK